MEPAIDRSVLEAGSIVLELNKHLTFSTRGSGDSAYYLVEDTLNSRFFRLGPLEYCFVTLLDGRQSMHAAYRRLSSLVPHHSLTETDVIALCQWLVEMDLAHTSQSRDGGVLAARVDKSQRKKFLANLNPLSFRFSCSVPHRWFERLAHLFKWMFTWQSLFALTMIALIAGYRVLLEWERFTSATQGIFAPTNWIWLAVCGIALKVIHELAHGLSCHVMGGRVRGAGIIVLLFAPLPYVDVTSSWRFPSTAKRMMVAGAGMIAELWIAAMAAIVWSVLEPGWLSHLCHNAVCLASFTTLVFNANPLMKFDGYYLLSDACGITNLYSHGQRCVNVALKYWLLGIRSTVIKFSSQTSMLIALYGWLSLLWRASVAVTLTIAATTLFGEASLVMAVLAVGTWLVAPPIIWLRSVIKTHSLQRSTVARGAITLAGMMVSLVTILAWVPWPGAKRAPAVVEYSPLTLIRASTNGFVRAIHVQRDQMVNQGELLLVMENQELAAEKKKLELEIRASEIRERRFEQKGELAAKQAEAKTREAKTVKLAEINRQFDALHVRAPESGRVVNRTLHQLLGKYIEQGDELACIGVESKKELRASVAQDDYRVFASRVGQSVTLDIPGLWLEKCLLEKIIPRAEMGSVPTALTTVHGGPIPVKQVKDAKSNLKQELLEPRLEAIAMLDNEQSSRLFCGQRVTIVYRPCNDSIGAHLYGIVRKSLENVSSQ